MTKLKSPVSLDGETIQSLEELADSKLFLLEKAGTYSFPTPQRTSFKFSIVGVDGYFPISEQAFNQLANHKNCVHVTLPIIRFSNDR